MAHLSTQILAAVAARLAPIAPVHMVPLHVIASESLPAIVIDEIEDETVDKIGQGPLEEKHLLSFTVFAAILASPATFAEQAGELRAQIETALLASEETVQLGGLCRSGLVRPSAVFRIDSDSLHKPVGGWALRFSCTYHLRTGP